MRRSPYLLALIPLLTLALGGLRWLLQGSHNLYTATSKRFYLPDPDLGYRPSTSGPLWLGLEVLAIIAAVALGTLGAAWVIARRERRLGRPWKLARLVVAIGVTLPLALPVIAFASGGRPSGAVDILPRASATATGTGITGTLPLPAGRYEVAAIAGAAITANLRAGGESFDARFAGGLTGFWQGDPGNLAAPMSAEVSAAAASVDTGVELRSTHARDEYLKVGTHPTIGFVLGAVRAASQTDPSTVSFQADATLRLMGADLAATVTGTLRAADAAARARLGTTGDTLVVTAETSLKISASPLASDADSFDTDLVPLHVSIILVRAPTR